MILREEQRQIYSALLGEWRSILINAYTGVGKTLPLLMRAIDFPGRKLIVTFRRNNYFSFLRESKRIEIDKNRSIRIVSIFSKEISSFGKVNRAAYFNAESVDILSKYSKLLGLYAYDWIYSLARSAEIIVVNANYLAKDSLFNILLKRSNIKPEESMLIIDEAHNLLELGISNPDYMINFISKFSMFNKIIGNTATPFPKELFAHFFDKEIKLVDRRQVRIIVDKKVNMAYDKRDKFIPYLSKELDNSEVVFYQNKYLANKLRKGKVQLVFRGKLNESVDIKGNRISIVGLPFPHISLMQNVTKLSNKFNIPEKEILFGYVMSKLIQAIGRILRTPQSTAEVYVYDNRILNSEMLKYLPPSYKVEIM